MSTPLQSLIARLALLCCIALGNGSAIPQGRMTPQDREQAAARAQALFGDYQTKYRGSGQQGADTLISVINGRLPQSPENAAALRALMVAKVSAAERVMLVRLLGMQYARANASGINQLILSDLRQQARSPDDDVAREAVYTYSRLGWLPDTLDVLDAARTRGLFDRDAYFGELAHLLPSASGANQARLARMISGSQSAYARSIIAMSFNGVLNDRYSSETRAELLTFFEAMEPRFSITASEYDYGQGMDYADWLRALGTLKIQGPDAQQAEFILQKLNGPLVDPRKVIAFLISAHGRWLVATVGNSAKFAPMIELISRYPKQYPQNAAALAEVVEYANQVVAGR